MSYIVILMSFQTISSNNYGCLTQRHRLELHVKYNYILLEDYIVLYIRVCEM